VVAAEEHRDPQVVFVLEIGLIGYVDDNQLDTKPTCRTAHDRESFAA
jgi:hypothetical protein